MTEPSYVPWLLREASGATWPWGIKDTRTGVNVLGDFLPEKTGAFCVDDPRGGRAVDTLGQETALDRPKLKTGDAVKTG